MFCRLYLASASLTAEPRVQMPMLPKQSLSCLTSRPTITESFRAMEGRSSGQRTRTLMDSGVMPLLRKCKILRDAQTQLQSRQPKFQPHCRLQHRRRLRRRLPHICQVRKACESHDDVIAHLLYCRRWMGGLRIQNTALTRDITQYLSHHNALNTSRNSSKSMVSGLGEEYDVHK